MSNDYQIEEFICMFCGRRAKPTKEQIDAALLEWGRNLTLDNLLDPFGFTGALRLHCPCGSGKNEGGYEMKARFTLMVTQE